MSNDYTNTNSRCTIGRPRLNREINTSHVLDLIFKQGTISRAELVKKTGIQAKTISSIVDQLSKNGIVKKVGLSKSKSGRPPVLYEIRSSGLYVIGLYLRTDKIVAVLINLHGKLIATQTKKLNGTSINTVVLMAKATVNELCDKASIPLYRVDGIGFAFPGLVDTKENKVIYSYPLGWEDVPLGFMLSDALNVDVKVVTDTIGNIINTCFQKRQKTPESMLLYFISFEHTSGEYIDISSAIALKGRAYLGRSSTIGQMVSHLKNPFYKTQERGRQKSFNKLKQSAEACLKDKNLAEQIWSPIAKDLATDLIHGSDLFDPSEIVISSDLPEFESLVGDLIREIFSNQSASALLRKKIKNKDLLPMPQITFQYRSETDIATGCALPFIEKLSNTPNIRE